jgi:Flp pilus assembly protein TadD
MKRMTQVAVFTFAFGVAAGGVGQVLHAAENEKTPTLSSDLARPLKAAQDAMKAKKFDDAIADLKIAQDSKGKKTDYDNYVIDSMMGLSYYQEQKFLDAAPLMHEAALSQYSPPEQAKQWLTAIMGIYYQAKNYPDTIATGQELIKRGSGDSSIYTTIALAQQAQGKNKEAAQTVQQIIDKQPKPEEKLLAFQWNAYLKANDSADADKVVMQLVKHYPKNDYWLNALSPLLSMNNQDAHLQLDIFRLMNEVGVLTRPGDYSEMAGLSLDQGFPGESVQVLQKAFASNAFTDPRDQERYKHQLTGAQQRADADQKSLPTQETQAHAAAGGDALVGVGAAYLSYGQPDKAVDLINQGIAKGSLKYPDQANLLLGIAELHAKKNSDAIAQFNKVATSSNQGYANLGKLWALHAESAKPAA